MRFDSEPRLQVVAAAQDRAVTARQAIALGYSRRVIAGRLANGRWRLLAPGVYLIDADLDPTVSLRTWWRAALLFHGPSSCLVAATAMHAFGIRDPHPRLHRIEVGVVGGPSRHGRRPATIRLRGRDDEAPVVVVRQFDIQPGELATHEGLQVRGLPYSLVDAALEADRPGALALLDSALHQDLITSEDLWDHVIRASGRRGVVALRDMARIADGRAASPLESMVRLACIDGRVAPDELQYPVHDRHGNLLAIGDLAWVRRRHRPLIAEADGQSVHSLPEAVLHDRRRGNALVSQACDTLRFTWADALRPAYIVGAVKAALAA